MARENYNRRGMVLAALVATAFAWGLCSAAPVNITATFVANSNLTMELVVTGLDKPRGMVYDNITSSLIVIARGSGTNGIVSIPIPPPPNDTTKGSGLTGLNRTVILDMSVTNALFAGGLTHGIWLDSNKTWLYASSLSTIYRWPYNGRSPLDPNAVQVVIRNIPADGNHNTRPIVLTPDGSYLYVDFPSADNVDPDSTHARVVRFPMQSFRTSPTDPVPTPLEWSSFQVVADGVRNGLALAFDPFYQTGDRRLWEADNGPDDLEDLTISPDLAEDNPPEEVNMFEIAEIESASYNASSPPFYGYPYCYTEGVFPAAYATGAGTQHQWPNTTSFPCTDATKNRPPVLTLPAHVAPMAITFFTTCGSSPHSLPCSWVGSAFISYHGSFHREVPQGFEIVRVPFSNDTRRPTGGAITVSGQAFPNTACVVDTLDSCFRPVGIVFDNWGRLFAAVDSTGDIMVLRAVAPGETFSAASTPQVIATTSSSLVVNSNNSVTGTTTAGASPSATSTAGAGQKGHAVRSSSRELGVTVMFSTMVLLVVAFLV
ncbi:hypothetical protein HDU93_002516 [Gonapodya sp. JEL0774]|nr:hypothetical protein HDU93_002516 [Gonapodya sp. JEL0774]